MQPSIQIPASATYGIWLRSSSVSGGKDWVCFQTPTGAVTFWGKTGQVNQSAFNENGKIQPLTNSKIQKGYYQIGIWQPATGWSEPEKQSQQPSLASLIAKPTLPKPKPQEIIQQWVSASDAPEWF